MSNDAINMYESLKRSGYETEIYAENIDKRLLGITKDIKTLKKTNKDDIIIYHKSTGTSLSYDLEKFKGKKIMRYHNITPEKYFEKYNKVLSNIVKYGREGLEYASKYIDFSIADSYYNKKELDELGYKNTEVIPILIPFEDYEKKADEKIIKKYQDGVKNIVFVGRIAPNKAQEDIIKSFYYYNNYINNNSRLILVGNSSGYNNYEDLL